MLSKFLCQHQNRASSLAKNSTTTDQPHKPRRAVVFSRQHGTTRSRRLAGRSWHHSSELTSQTFKRQLKTCLFHIWCVAELEEHYHLLTLLWCFCDSGTTVDSLTWKQSLTDTSIILPTVLCYSSWQLNAGKKVSSTVHPYERIGGVLHFPVIGFEPIGSYTTKSMMRGRCVARPTVTFLGSSRIGDLWVASLMPYL